MADLFDSTRTEDEIERVVRQVIISVRRSLESPYQAQSREGIESVNIIRDLILEIERARLALSPMIMASRSRQRQSIQFWVEFLRIIRSILADPMYLRIIRFVRFRFSSLPSSLAKANGMSRYASMSGEASIETILATLADDVSTFIHSESSDNPQAVTLKSIVPHQKMAPIQFEIRDHRIFVIKRTSKSEVGDRSNIASAKEELVKSGEKILKELKQSNCDKRFLESIENLQIVLMDNADAIKLGIASIGCDAMCKQFEEELPAAVLGMLNSHIRGVQLYVGQFPEWNRFLENAASADLDSSDVQDLKQAVSKIVDELKTKSDLVDPEVPRSLALLNELLNRPGASGKRAGFAMLRSLENLISVIYSHGADYLQKTATKTVEGAAFITSKIILAAVLTVALDAATSIGPVASKVSEMSWMRAASEIVKKQLDDLKK